MSARLPPPVRAMAMIAAVSGVTPSALRSQVNQPGSLRQVRLRATQMRPVPGDQAAPDAGRQEAEPAEIGPQGGVGPWLAAAQVEIGPVGEAADDVQALRLRQQRNPERDRHQQNRASVSRVHSVRQARKKRRSGAIHAYGYPRNSLPCSSPQRPLTTAGPNRRHNAIFSPIAQAKSNLLSPANGPDRYLGVERGLARNPGFDCGGSHTSRIEHIETVAKHGVRSVATTPVGRRRV